MEDDRLAATAGALASLALLATIVAPYVLVPGNEQQALAAYYGGGVVGPTVVALVAGVGVIVFAAGRQGRTEPETAAGAGVTLGAFGVVLSLVWALTTDTAVLLNTSADWLPLHRWIVVAAAVAVAAAGAGYARALRLL